MKKLLIIFGAIMLSVPLFAKDTAKTLDPIYQARTTNAMTIYNLPNSSAATTGVTLYVTGGSTTSAVSYYVGTSSLTITTTGGLYPGTTWFVFADTRMDTLTELINYAFGLADTQIGGEGGIIMSTTSVAYGVISSARLTAGQSGSCLGASNVVSLTVTPAAAQTSRYEIGASTIGFITTNGLFPGSTIFVLAGTVDEFVARLEALPSTMPGIDGTLVITIPDGSCRANLAADLTASASAMVNFREASAVKTLTADTVYGITYILDSNDLSGEEQWHITGINVNATFASGTTYVNIYDGLTTSATQILKYEVDTTATETNIILPSGGELAGSENTAMRIDVVGTAAVTAGYLNIRGFKE